MYGLKSFGWSLPFIPTLPFEVQESDPWLLISGSVLIHQSMLFTISSRWVRSCLIYKNQNILIGIENETSNNGYAERQMNQSVVSFFLGQQFFFEFLSGPTVLFYINKCKQLFMCTCQQWYFSSGWWTNGGNASPTLSGLVLSNLQWCIAADC